MLAEGLTRARDQIGYRQQDVATALGVTRAMISYWENGRRVPSDPQLAALGRLYRTSIAELLDGYPSREPNLPAMMLRGGTDLAPTARSGIQDFLNFLDRYGQLAELLGVELRTTSASPFPAIRGAGSAEDARRKAEEVRAHLRIGLGPVTDLDVVCALLGVTVYRASLGPDLDKSLSGAFFNHPEVGFSLLVNMGMTLGRRRFTIAHELAHALFHSGPTTKYLLSGSVKTPQERFADRFAGEFLMPTEGIQRIMEEYGMGSRVTEPADVIHLQRYFNVSYATSLVRLRQGRFLTEQKYQSFRSISSVAYARNLGYEIHENEPTQRPEDLGVARFPRRFIRLLRWAIREDHISIPTALELTGLLIDQVEELVNDPGPVQLADLMREFTEYEITGVPDL